MGHEAELTRVAPGARQHMLDALSTVKRSLGDNQLTVYRWLRAPHLWRFLTSVDQRDDIECDLFPSIDTSFNLREYILECFINKNINESCDDSLKSKFERIEYELSCFDKLKKQDLLYIVIHITNYLNTNKIVWSARGSSSASYVLYVLGIHHIDSFLYDLDPTEFFKIV